MTGLPYARHIIFAAGLSHSEVLGIYINTRGVEIANKDIDVPPFDDATFLTGINGLEILDDYLYSTSTGHQTRKCVKINKSDYRIGVTRL